MSGPPPSTFIVVFEPNGFPRWALITPVSDFSFLVDNNQNFVVVEGECPPDIHSHWYCDLESGELARRPEIAATISSSVIAADGVAECIIAGLPDPVTLTMDGVEHVIEGGEITITASTPGVFRLAIDQWPYLPWETEITAQ
ncbi:hypothetical protein GA830_12235 [Mesorhizobium sp. NBSH29]|uniref:hypothetical protein n=1 Tax=Mesorhizobium sp. NBSH29 TaxID=2654249 RepID=UPI00189671A7|nr:hypothetical protein [Mesorhizobium sp. NBSH29]QPC87426.1 hypothetical protein GA830_12235 [Mesorhizobium sp. NBSH29]